jgi:outer membrane scaffolding protein for murein synthesis (MipA/OmpV family)
MLAHRFAAAMLAAAFAAGPAAAQQLLDVAPGLDAPERPTTRWTVTIGALGAVRPAYEGSDAYVGSAVPVFDLRYRDIFFASVRDGIGVNVLREDWVTLAPVLRYRFGRDQDANRALYGMGDIDGTFEAGILATFGTGPLRLRLEAAQGLNGGGSEGFQTRADLTYGTVLGPRLFVAGGPNMTYGDRSFNQTYFGVSPQQSVRSGYQQFSAAAGLNSVGLSATANYRLWRGFSLTATGEVKQLLYDAADSPITREQTQAFFGLALAWRGGW